jgi:hypothetical protein
MRIYTSLCQLYWSNSVAFLPKSLSAFFLCVLDLLFMSLLITVGQLYDSAFVMEV